MIRVVSLWPHGAVGVVDRPPPGPRPARVGVHLVRRGHLRGVARGGQAGRLRVRARHGPRPRQARVRQAAGGRRDRRRGAGCSSARSRRRSASGTRGNRRGRNRCAGKWRTCAWGRIRKKLLPENRIRKKNKRWFRSRSPPVPSWTTSLATPCAVSDWNGSRTSSRGASPTASPKRPAGTSPKSTSTHPGSRRRTRANERTSTQRRRRAPRRTPRRRRRRRRFCKKCTKRRDASSRDARFGCLRRRWRCSARPRWTETWRRCASATARPAAPDRVAGGG